MKKFLTSTLLGPGGGRKHAPSAVSMRGARARCVALVVAALVPAVSLAADPFPSRPLTMVVPYAAGGSTDWISRSLAASMARELGQPVVIDNKAGAGGMLGAQQVARAAPDGYTMLMGTLGDQVNAPAMAARPAYDAARDFEPIGCAVRTPSVLVVHPGVAAKSMAELTRLAKSSTGRVNYASSGIGSTSHLQGELLAQLTGATLTHVPYRGSAPALTDLMSGQVQMMFVSPNSVQQQVKTGTLRALATTSKDRLPELPEVPTLREAGVPMEVYSWACLFAPAKTPVPVLDRLDAALKKALQDPAVRQSIEGSGGEAFATSRDEARRFVASERDKWKVLIRARNIRAESGG